jgi:predicted RecB family endonuclease
MTQARPLAALGEQARGAANISPRQPLALARLAAPGAEQLAVEHADLLKAALNVQALQVVEHLSGEEPPDWATAVQDEWTVALEARLTPELALAGLAGEFIRRVQEFRKRSEFAPASISACSSAPRRAWPRPSKRTRPL